MSKSTKRLLTVIFLGLMGFASNEVTSSGQELEGREEGGNRGGFRTTRPPTYNGLEDFQFGRGGEMGGAPTEPAAETIALTFWVLTVTESAAPEAEELVGKLLDRVKSLPEVIGTSEEVRDLVGRLKVAGLLEKSREYRLATLDGQTVTSQTGSTQPTIVGTNVTNRGGRSNSFNFQQVGTMITATPRIDAGSRIQVSLSYQASGVEKSKQAILEQQGEGEPVFADVTTNQQVNTTLRLKSGTAVLVSSDASHDAGAESTGGQTRMIVLAATVLPALDVPQAAAKIEPPASRVDLEVESAEN